MRNNNPAASDGGVQSLRRAFELLEALADLNGEAGVSALAARTGMPTPTIHRLVRTLVDLGYVRQNTDRRYALGGRLIRLGQSAGRMFGAWTRPYLCELVEATGETANLAVLEGNHVVYVAQVPSQYSMRMFTEVGRRLLPHGTGVGKAMLSRLSADDVRALLGRTGMPAYTPQTHTDPDEFIEHIAMVAEQGFALDEGEQEIGVRCVAVDLNAMPTPMAVSVSGPEGRLTLDVANRLTPVVVDIAARMSAHLQRELGQVQLAPGGLR